MNGQFLIDTCGWIEWLTNGVLVEQFTPYFKQPSNIIVPTVLQYELYKWVCREQNEIEAQSIITISKQSKVIPLDTSLALLAAKLASQYKLSVADALIYATAQHKEAELITSDNHFFNLPGVCYFSK
ncbi:type II toxin-antitoxin system VapC family toxin [Candidatus Marithioploca araucensis]|uniref:Type II toxin-antitoxin system VapC family toxin n=1 Tax=Candidatus Marithioploca araucensis TaxID=70273 RepID=A0ABT7VUB5_9GAMM|nr:type II toxin-antitoxin system VapC family toxin [Candidatus Marithioploca araucensis]